MEDELQTRARLGFARRRLPASASSNSSSRSCRSNASRASACPILGASSANCCSRWCPTSSMICASSSGLRPAPARRARTSERQSNVSGRSRISHPRNPIDRGDELAPRGALCVQRSAAGRSDSIVSAPPFARLFHPATDDQSAVLHPIEEGIERRHVEYEDTCRARFDQLLQLVAVAGFGVEQRQHEKLGAAFLELVGQHGESDICETHIYPDGARRQRRWISGRNSR